MTSRPFCCGKEFHVALNERGGFLFVCTVCGKEELPYTDNYSKVRDTIIKEAEILRIEHPSKDCRAFADSVFKHLKQLEEK